MEILGKDAMKTIKRALAGVLACSGLLFAGAALAVGDSPGGPRVNEINFQPPVTKIAEELYDLHTMMLILCTVIFVGVFGVMFYSIFAHRKSKGHKAANFHESTTVEIIWTIVPFVIVVLMALPATGRQSRPVYPDELGRTQYMVFAGLDTDMNIIAYAVVPVQIPAQ